MNQHTITTFHLSTYIQWLENEEKSAATIEKYSRDIRHFINFLHQQPLDKNSVIAYKNHLLTKGYAPSSINSMLAALNSFLNYYGWTDCRVKVVRTQRPIYCSATQELSKAEYYRLIYAAQRRNDTRMVLLLQTICCTGIRISEVQYITVEAVQKGEASVSCKGKTRKIFLVSSIRKQLSLYIRTNHIKKGPVFITCHGNPMNRSNIWREMKKLCTEARVKPSKVTPHNLRHLFARTFYEKDKDLAKLADILGHSSINTTRIYIITTEKEHRKCMERLQLTL